MTTELRAFLRGSIDEIYRGFARQDAVELGRSLLSFLAQRGELAAFLRHSNEVAAEGINNELQPIRDLKL